MGNKKTLKALVKAMSEHFDLRPSEAEHWVEILNAQLAQANATDFEAPLSPREGVQVLQEKAVILQPYDTTGRRIISYSAIAVQEYQNTRH